MVILGQQGCLHVPYFFDLSTPDTSLASRCRTSIQAALKPRPKWDYWMNDVVVSADDFDEAYADFEKLLNLAHGLMFSPKKTKLFVQETSLGGQTVGQDGVSADPKEIEPILAWQPTAESCQDLNTINMVLAYQR
jgi:hypothetical protein